MGRGLISGAIWGAVVSGGALSLASLLGEQPAGNTPPAPPQVEAPMPSDAAPEVALVEPGDASDTTSIAEDAVLSTAPAAPVVDVPDVSTDSPAPDTTPAAQPETGDVNVDLDAPSEAPAPDVASEAVDPVLPAPQAPPPAAPTSEDDLSISTEPAQPPAPDPVPDSGFSDESAPTDETTGEVADEAAAPADGSEPSLDEPAEDPTADVTTADEAPAEDTQPEPEAAPEPETQTAEAATDEATDTSTTLPQGDSSIVIRRPESSSLITDTPDQGASDDVIVVEAVPEDAPALLRFAAGYEPQEGKPFMSVILVDDGSMDSAGAALAGLPFPVTIALDPGLTGSAELAASYRDAGFEVLAIANLPEGAQPSDAEVILEGTFTTLPEAIGMIDAGAGQLSSGTLTEQVMDALASEGRGFVTVSRGLNTALRTAERSEVPAATIYRDLDSEDQDARVIRRFLDQAAFRARQESGVVMLGRVRPDTISALILWGTANRAGQVALVPVSAVLRGDE